MKIMTKKPVFIIAVLLSGLAFMGSCSKEPKGKGGNKPKKIVVATSVPPDARNAFNAVRTRQNVKLTWKIDADADKLTGIILMRSDTGKTNTTKRVAKLEPKTTRWEDSLPNENAYWYWLILRMKDGKNHEIGPVRVDADRNGTTGYIRQEDAYKVSITRTDDFATLTWNFPDSIYEEIIIIRAPRPLTEPFRKTGIITTVTTTVEGKSQNINALPDANSEYWYWFRITLKSGLIIYKGPIKAEYTGQ